MSAQQKVKNNTMVNRLSLVGIGGNIVLSAFKLCAGILGNSGAMISDAVHSLSDVFATFIAFLGVRLSQRKADKTHPYGHERIESLASLALGCILVITGIGIGWVGVEKIFAGNYEQLATPSALALVAAAVSIVVKEAMYWYTRHYAKILNSSAFMADAWHHRSDAFSSIGALVGIGGAMLGFPLCDPLASVVICFFILKAAYDILRDAIKNMLDTPCDAALEQKISQTLTTHEGIRGLDLLRTRQFGNRVYVDAEIAVSGDLKLRDAHSIAEAAHNKIEQEFSAVKHIMIHVNPAEEERGAAL